MGEQQPKEYIITGEQAEEYAKLYAEANTADMAPMTKVHEVANKFLISLHSRPAPQQPEPAVFKYIRFVKIQQKEKTAVYECRNVSGDYVIGIVKWYPGWRQYCFFPGPDMVFSKGCMENVCTFISNLQSQRREGKS